MIFEFNLLWCTKKFWHTNLKTTPNHLFSVATMISLLSVHMLVIFVRLLVVVYFLLGFSLVSLDGYQTCETFDKAQVTMNIKFSKTKAIYAKICCNISIYIKSYKKTKTTCCQLATLIHHILIYMTIFQKSLQYHIINNFPYFSKDGKISYFLAKSNFNWYHVWYVFPFWIFAIGFCTFLEYFNFNQAKSQLLRKQEIYNYLQGQLFIIQTSTNKCDCEPKPNVDVMDALKPKRRYQLIRFQDKTEYTLCNKKEQASKEVLWRLTTPSTLTSINTIINP